jgi:hypothetical protein
VPGYNRLNRATEDAPSNTLLTVISGRSGFANPC